MKSQSNFLLLSKISRILFWIGVSIVMIAVSLSAISWKNLTRVSDIECKIKDKNGNFFIHEQDVKNEIYKLNPNFKSSRIIDIKVQQIEDNLKLNSYIDKAEIVMNIEGKMNIEVVQKNPIARINSSYGSFYLSEKWEIMPISTKFSKRVVHILGNNSFALEPKNSIDSIRNIRLRDLINRVKSDAFWNAALDQIYFTPNGDLEFVLSFSASIHKMGKLDNDLELRMNKVVNYYKLGAPYVDFNLYKVLDFRFEQQVVGIKKSK